MEIIEDYSPYERKRINITPSLLRTLQRIIEYDNTLSYKVIQHKVPIVCDGFSVKMIYSENVDIFSNKKYLLGIIELSDDYYLIKIGRWRHMAVMLSNWILIDGRDELEDFLLGKKYRIV